MADEINPVPVPLSPDVMKLAGLALIDQRGI